VDVHCHCLPGLDDGPGSIRESLMLCRALAQDNIDSAVATPHQLGRFEIHTDVQRIRQAVQYLNGELLDHGIDLKVLPGAEIRVDERINALLAGEEILTLADKGRHVLLEFPPDVFIDIDPLVNQLHARGVEIIIAHPERSMPLLREPHALQRWLNCGVALQVTAASLTGRFGPEAVRAAWTLVAEGAAGIVATDAHDPGAGEPCMTAAFKMISASCGPEWARLLCIENPARVLRGEGLPPAFWRERRGIG
jgi:protein-tyrosine phosphatase